MNRCTRICAMSDPDKGCLLGLGDNCTVGPDKEYQRPAPSESGSVRDKLLDLIIEAKKADTEDAPFSEFLADFLIANGVTVQEWIPVTERLPKEGEDVLAFGYWHEKWQPLKCHYIIRFNGQWFTSVAGQQVYAVTHWMPLPSAPKGE